MWDQDILNAHIWFSIYLINPFNYKFWMTVVFGYDLLIKAAYLFEIMARHYLYRFDPSLRVVQGNISSPLNFFTWYWRVWEENGPTFVSRDMIEELGTYIRVKESKKAKSYELRISVREVNYWYHALLLISGFSVASE